MKSKTMSNINVLILFNSFRNYSGGDHFLIQLFKRVRSKFNNVYCISNEKGKAFIDRDIKNVNFITTRNIFDKFNIMISYIFRTIQALSCLKLNSINLIYVSSDFFPDVLPAFIYKKIYPKSIWHQYIFHIYPSHKNRPGRKVKNFIAQYLQKFSFLFIKSADVIININQQVRAELIGIGFNSEKIIINTPGIDVNYLSNIEFDKNTPSFNATFLGRINPTKGIYDLIKIWEIVVGKFPQARLAIIGAGNMQITSKLNRLIIDSELTNNISILGFIESDDAFKIIKKSNMFLFPSHEEGFGIAIAEAMALRVPVIGWHLGVYDEVYRDTIFKIPIGDINSFAKKVIDLLSDHDAIKQMTNKGFDFIKKYDWDNITENYLKVAVKSLFKDEG